MNRIRRGGGGAASLLRPIAAGTLWALDRADAVSGTILERWLVAGFAGLSGLWLLLWASHYVYWPWCRDADTYAQMALDWDHGVLPYRDIRAFNFPGHIYLHWVLGKLFGWGRTSLFYALDATALLTLGAVVVAWSRRRLGCLLPGTLAYCMFLAYYLGLSFESVAERDWHVPWCATLTSPRSCWRPWATTRGPRMRGRRTARGTLNGERCWRPWNGSARQASSSCSGSRRCSCPGCWAISSAGSPC